MTQGPVWGLGGLMWLGTALMLAVVLCGSGMGGSGSSRVVLALSWGV